MTCSLDMAARCMSGILPKFTIRRWKYPKMQKVLAAAGLRTIEHYVQVRRARILNWVQDRPILKMCREAEEGADLRLAFIGGKKQCMWTKQPGGGAVLAEEGDRGEGGGAP